MKILDKGFSSSIEIFSKKGTIRANHYHKKDEHFCYILKGEILFFYRNRSKGSKLNYKVMKKGDLFFTTYNQDHLAYFLKNTHFLSYSIFVAIYQYFSCSFRCRIWVSRIY